MAFEIKQYRSAITSGSLPHAMQFTSSGSGTPSCAIFFATLATANETAVADACLSYGFWDGSSGRCVALHEREDDTNSMSYKGKRSDGKFVLYNLNTPTLYATGAMSNITDGVQIDWTAASGNYLINAIVFWGLANAKVGDIDVTMNLDETSNTDVGFVPDDVLTLYTGSGSADTTIWHLGFGLADNDGNTPPINRCYHHYSRHNRATSELTSLRSESKIVTFSDHFQITTKYEITAFISSPVSGFTTKKTNSGTHTGQPFYLAMKFPAGVGHFVGNRTTPTAAIDHNTTWSGGFKPKCVIETLGRSVASLDATDAAGTSGSKGISCYTLDDDKQFSAVAMIRDAAASTTPRYARSWASDKFVSFPQHTGATGDVGTWDVTDQPDTGYRTAFTAVRGTADTWHFLAIGQEPSLPDLDSASLTITAYPVIFAPVLGTASLTLTAHDLSPRATLASAQITIDAYSVSVTETVESASLVLSAYELSPVATAEKAQATIEAYTLGYRENLESATATFTAYELSPIGTLASAQLTITAYDQTPLSPGALENAEATITGYELSLVATAEKAQATIEAYELIASETVESASLTVAAHEMSPIGTLESAQVTVTAYSVTPLTVGVLDSAEMTIEAHEVTAAYSLARASVVFDAYELSPVVTLEAAEIRYQAWELTPDHVTTFDLEADVAADVVFDSYLDVTFGFYADLAIESQVSINLHGDLVFVPSLNAAVVTIEGHELLSLETLEFASLTVTAYEVDYIDVGDLKAARMTVTAYVVSPVATLEAAEIMITAYVVIPFDVSGMDAAALTVDAYDLSPVATLGSAEIVFTAYELGSLFASTMSVATMAMEAYPVDPILIIATPARPRGYSVTISLVGESRSLSIRGTDESVSLEGVAR